MPKQLQIKITLVNIKPPIWRRLEIRDDITFYDLHLIIQAALDWYNYHLFEFDMGAFKIGIPYDDDFEETVDAKKVKISKYLKSEGIQLSYVYDFGDFWQHKILVEKITPIDKAKNYPRCIKGKRNGPPEDCGGPWGYEGLLEALKDKNHPDHQEMVDWIGDELDPEEFDLNEINLRLQGR